MNSKLDYFFHIRAISFPSLSTDHEVSQNLSQPIFPPNLIIQLAIVGGLLAIFILWIFLNNLMSVLASAIGLAIPISVYAAFNFYAAGISSDHLTLLGMALARHAAGQ